MTEELPEGWCWATVEQLVSSTDYGTSAKTNEDSDGIPVLRMGNIVDGALSLTNLKYLPADHDEFPKLLLQPGDLLFNRTNSPELVGKSAVYTGSPKQCSFASYLIRLKSQGMLPYLLAAYINSPYGRAWVRSVVQQQVGQANVNGSRLLALTVPVPPLAEQRRIVAKIEGLTARSRATRAALAEVPTLLEQFRQSVMASAFRGDLTANWREKHPDTEPAAVLLASIRDERRKQWEAKYPKKKYVAPDPVDDADLPELPVGWEYARADEVVAAGTVITYGIVLPGDQVEGGVPYVRGQDIEDGRILVEQLARTSPEIAARHDRSSLLEGDVLLCIIRHLKVAVVPAGMDGANLTQGTVRLRPSDAILGPYLAGYLAGPTAQGWMKERYFGMAMPRINVEDARAIPIPVAPLEEQREIIRQIEVTGRRHQAVVAAVTHPSEDTPRLALADWLQEHDEEAVAVAIRASVRDRGWGRFPDTVRDRWSPWNACHGGWPGIIGRTRPGDLPDSPWLTSLELTGNRVTDAGLKELAALTNLTYLDLRNTPVTDAGLEELAPLEHLAQLDLTDTPVTDAGLKRLVRLQNLTGLGLFRTRVTHEGLGELANFNKLTSVWLSEVTDRTLGVLREVHRLPVLGNAEAAGNGRPIMPEDVIRLNLDGTQVTDAGLRELAAFKNLTNLYLGGSPVTDAGLKELAVFKNLTTLTLHDTRVTDDGLKELAPLKNLATLTVPCRITDDGLKELAPLKSLTTLYLGCTCVTDAGVQELQRALPRCKIEK
ncbi:MAG: restriction endonuclease subunit S [Gemmata sp.]